MYLFLDVYFASVLEFRLKKERKPRWYYKAYEYGKTILFALLGIFFVRFLTKSPPPETEAEESFDEAKYFEEYVNFCTYFFLLQFVSFSGRFLL